MMTDTGKKGKKKKGKGKTLNLNEFLSGGSGAAGSSFATKKTLDLEENEAGPNEVAHDWEDDQPKKKEIFDLSRLPTAPRSSRDAVDLSKLPTQPPFTAFLGNLAFDVEENDISDFFSDLKLEKVRLPRENGRLRGFGYAEFCDVESLVEAFKLNNEVLKGRKIRVDIAGHSGTADGQGRDDGREDRSSDWRKREGPTTQGDQERRNFDRTRDGGLRGDRRDGQGQWRTENNEADTASSWRRADPLPPHQSEQRRNLSTGTQGERNQGFSEADNASDWRRDAAASSDDRRRNFGRDTEKRGYSREADTASSWRSNPREARGREPRAMQPGQSGYDQEQRGRSTDGMSQEVPKERPRLNLKPRTVEDGKSQENTPNSSIFGGARPVDTASKEKRIEEKMIKERHRANVGSPERTSAAEVQPSVETNEESSRSHDNHQSKKDRTRLMRANLSTNESSSQRNKETSPGDNHESPDGTEPDESTEDFVSNANEANKSAKQENLLRHYEEPKAPVFVQKSVFSVLADEDDEQISSENED